MAAKRQRKPAPRKKQRKKNILAPLALATGAAGTAAMTAAIPGYYRDAQGVYRDAKTHVKKFVTRLSNPAEDIEFLNDMAPLISQGHLAFTQDGLEEFIRDGYVYHAFANTPVFADGYRMGTPIESLEEVAQQNPAKFDRCVKAVRASSSRTGRPTNAYAVCTAAGTRNPRRNPAAESDALYETFHGIPPSETLEIEETEHIHEHLAGLGALVSIVVRLANGKYKGQKFDMKAPDPDVAPPEQIVHVAANEAANQLYLVGGDQSLDLEALGFREAFNIKHDGESFEVTDIRDLMTIGPIIKLTYRTQKAFDKFEDVDYYHALGEDTKERALLLYDTVNQRLKIAGGEYSIQQPGVIN